MPGRALRTLALATIAVPIVLHRIMPRLHLRVDAPRVSTGRLTLAADAPCWMLVICPLHPSTRPAVWNHLILSRHVEE